MFEGGVCPFAFAFAFAVHRACACRPLGVCRLGCVCGAGVEVFVPRGVVVFESARLVLAGGVVFEAERFRQGGVGDVSAGGDVEVAQRLAGVSH